MPRCIDDDNNDNDDDDRYAGLEHDPLPEGPEDQRADEAAEYARLLREDPDDPELNTLLEIRFGPLVARQLRRAAAAAPPSPDSKHNHERDPLVAALRAALADMADPQATAATNAENETNSANLRRDSNAHFAALASRMHPILKSGDETIRAIPRHDPANPSLDGPSADDPSVDGLTPAQDIAVAALVAGHRVTQAAERACVSRRTVHRWLESDPAFQAALRRQQAEIVTAARAELMALAQGALAGLTDSLDRDLKLAVTFLKCTGVLAPENPCLADASHHPAETPSAGAIGEGHAPCAAEGVPHVEGSPPATGPRAIGEPGASAAQSADDPLAEADLDDLKPAQRRAVHSLLAGKSIAAAARDARCSARSLHLWMAADPYFQRVLARQRTELRESLRAQVLRRVYLALRCIERHIAANPRLACTLLAGLGLTRRAA